ncbi:sterol desaturase family protein [Cellulophaga tyrosinoxydans]|uniref:Lathosterol oxidase n=1 Tax=Cellulophaga tyrosinoxydans TaxID=504486 RepID=A0A1W2AYB8_9FLAO|nr:sterol desaturase family protein [Cellulophaga tyrosinoxydans]SMC65168.1 lathosterol oxidase [Cellulophaga tyrosinoxydans]
MKSENNRMRIGEGRISGAISIFLGVSSLASILCFKFPEQFTTPEFREVYTAAMAENLILGGIISTFLFALLSILLAKNKKYAVVGVVLGALSVLLGGMTVEGRAVEKTNWSLGLDWLILDLLVMVLIFVPIELVFPKNKLQSKFHPEWKTDLIYFGISHLAIQLFGVLTKKPAVAFFGWMNLDGVQQWVNDLPFVIELFIALVVTDLFQYAAHRIFHSHYFLWRFHSIHHSTENMDWLAGSRTHFIDIFFTRSMSYLPLYILGFSTLTFNVYIVFIAIHAVFIHANTRLNFGLLKYVITTPQYHHWHHCKEPEHYGNNFAVVFPFIDKLFGTYYLPGNEWPEGTGLVDASFPKGFMKQFTYPFIKNPFKNDLLPEEKSGR